MGKGLAKNMVAKGQDLTVADLDHDKVVLAVALGAKAGGTPAEMGASCDVLMICVTTAEAVQEIALGPDGALAAMSPGDVLVDHTTVSAAHVDKMHAACKAVGVFYAEAPMTRTPAHADRGEANILFGGEENLMERLRPVFETYAENIFHVGPAGHAIRLKLIHNYIAFAKALRSLQKRDST